MNRRGFLAQGALAALAAAGGVRAAAVQSGAAPARRIRIAQIGTAHSHAAEKWQTLRRLPEVFDCVGLCEPDRALRAKASAQAEYAGAPWKEESELFASGGIDAVLVETELPDLLRTGERVLAAGWHLHLDKPPGRSLAGFDALQAQAVRVGRVLQHGYMYRYHPAVTFCFGAVEKGWLGKIVSIHGEVGKVIGPGRRPWLAEHYGGSMMLLGCHLLDLAIALLGAPDRVAAYRRKTFPSRDSFSDHEVAVLEYPEALATIRSVLVEVEGEDRRQFVVCGENATIEILPLEPARVRIAFKQPPTGFKAAYQEVPLPGPDGRYGAQLLDFAGQVLGRPSVLPRYDTRHERRVHETLLAFGQS